MEAAQYKAQYYIGTRFHKKCKIFAKKVTAKINGLLNFTQRIINIGATYGKVDASTLLPDPTTVSRRTHKIAEEVRDDVLPEIKKEYKEAVDKLHETFTVFPQP